MIGEYGTNHKDGIAAITKKAAEFLPEVNRDLNCEDYIGG